MDQVQTATVVVQYVNPVKPGKKNGTIKTKDGVYYGVPPQLLASFQQGGTYQIAYTTRSFQGQTYMTVTQANLVAPPASGGGSGGRGGGGKDDGVVAERIFVCGALNAAIQGGHLALISSDIENTVLMLREVWGKTLGAGGAPQAPKNEMDDEVPF